MCALVLFPSSGGSEWGFNNLSRQFGRVQGVLVGSKEKIVTSHVAPDELLPAPATVVALVLGDEHGTPRGSGYCKLHPRQPFPPSLDVHPEGEKKNNSKQNKSRTKKITTFFLFFDKKKEKRGATFKKKKKKITCI